MYLKNYSFMKRPESYIPILKDNVDQKELYRVEIILYASKEDLEKLQSKSIVEALSK